nr:PREDICTED: bolA-like protein 2 [Anolis carolinensis]|eukprot:XP_008115458.1 PREDICTED: bolA-like protein 2 [Anolis carolinensis]
MEPSVVLSAESLRERLLQGLEAEHVEVEDTTPGRCATSFKVLVVSPCFRGRHCYKNGLQQSKLPESIFAFFLFVILSFLRHLIFPSLVNELLSEELKHIHAFEQRTLTPEQWAKEQEAK